MASLMPENGANKSDVNGIYRHLESMDSNKDARIMAIDVGSTTLRCYIYDRHMTVEAMASARIQLLYPAPRHVEIDPDTLWKQTQEVVNNALQAASLQIGAISCIGLSVQRNTFINWHRVTGKPFHGFISWQDLRASDLVKSWNRSYTMKAFSSSTKVLHSITRHERFLSASVLRFTTAQVTLRLKWMLENNKEMKEEATQGNVQFGTIDTWLLWKLTGGTVWATDYSCASATGMFDPFVMEWSSTVCSLVGLPMNILPPIRDTSGIFGTCSPDLFGAPVPITAMVADQQGATFGQGCFSLGDISLTLGTGSFMDCHTGSKPHASVAGLYPLVGWKIGDELAFVAECMASDTGRCIDWLGDLGLFDDVSATSDIAQSVSDSNGTYFIPAFSGLQAPTNDDKACASLIGIKPNTTKEHLVRAVLESLAFKTKLLYDTAIEETKNPLKDSIRVDGGLSKNDFLMQLTADLLGVPLERPWHTDMTSVGATFLAGLAAGVWKSKEELLVLSKSGKTFQPSEKRQQDYLPILVEWQRAMQRSCGWYKDVDL